jgi:transposase
VPELRRFAANLTADLSAVRAAFSSPWSSGGQVEGQINRLKYLKRQMYGRAKLDLLRICMLHPN